MQWTEERERKSEHFEQIQPDSTRRMESNLDLTLPEEHNTSVYNQFQLLGGPVHSIQQANINYLYRILIEPDSARRMESKLNLALSEG